MILGVDHIALSCNDINAGIGFLKKFGFKTKFIEKDVINHEFKRSFLKMYDPRHSIAYCQSDKGVAIELTKHSSNLVESISPYQVFFNIVPFDIKLKNSLESSLPKNIWTAALGYSNASLAIWEPLSAHLWYDRQSDGPHPGHIKSVILPVAQLSKAENFWIQGLGFKLVKRSSISDTSQWAHITFNALVKAWSIDIVLVENYPLNKRYLDDTGFPCLALISNRLDEDLKIAKVNGACETSNGFQLNIGGKLLKIVIVRGPDNELIELIEFSR